MEGQFMAAACRMLSTHAAAQGTADQARVLVTFTTALAKQHWAPSVHAHPPFVLLYAQQQLSSRCTACTTEVRMGWCMDRN